MRYVEVEGARLSVIGLGTWQFGSREWGYGDDYARREAGAIVERALDLGVNLVDTAEIYGFGRSEQIVGRAIAARRDDVFLATKIFPLAPIAPVLPWRARESARRLGVDELDLYQVHWPNPFVPDAPTMRAMRTVIDDELVRYAGVSNFGLARWQHAEQCLGRPVLTDQVRFSLVDRRPETRGLVAYAHEHGRVVIAYSPLAQGFLSGRYDPANRPSDRVRRTSALFLPENLARGTELLETLRAVGKAHDATPSQVALAWLVRRPNVVAIPGASSVAQLEANVAAADLALTDDEDGALAAAAEAFRPVSGASALAPLARELLRR